MKKAFLIILTLSCLLICSCKYTATRNDSDVYYSFTDDTGKQIVLQKKPQKVAVLFSSLADIWNLSGGTVSVTVGESVERGFADESVMLVDEGSGHTSINNEILISETPDFIIGTADYACQVESCSFTNNKGIPSASFKIESFDDYLRVLKIFCDINGTPENYEKYGEKVKHDINSILESTTASRSPKVLFIRAGSSARSVKAKNSNDNFVCAMLDQLGTHNIADNSPALLDGLSLEYILLCEPDHVFISSMGDENASREYVAEMFRESGWKDLDCIKNERYTFLPKELFHYKPNSKWADAYRYLIKILYPENKID